MKNLQASMHQKVITLNELLVWQNKMLETEKQFLVKATQTKDDVMKKYHLSNASVVHNQLSFLERLINQASEKGEKVCVQ